MILRFNENKMWHKDINQILNYIENVSKKPLCFLDCETTGLAGPKKEQITQISSISTNYNFSSNSFDEIGLFDEKIKLNYEIKKRYYEPNDDSRKILSFNHYGSGKYKYKNELDVVKDFFNWVDEYSPCLLVAQNASFDMKMLGGRYNFKIKNEVFDTKMLIQLYFIPLIQKLAENDDKYKDMIENIGTSIRDNGLISSSMSKIGPALGINMAGYHDALSDCRITMKMFTKIIELLKENKDIDIMKYQVERIKTLRLYK